MVADNRINKDTPISVAIDICPRADEVFTSHGMGCFECLAAAAETVGDGAEMHGIDPDLLIEELNKACKE